MRISVEEEPKNKMENTLENKAKFLLPYMGQTLIKHESDNCLFKFTELSLIDLEIGIWGDFSGGTQPGTACNDMIGLAGVVIQLKAVAHITDDDLVACYHINSGIIGYDYTMDFSPVIDMARHWFKNGGLNDLSKYTSTHKYLESRGYYLGDGKEVSFGWIDLVTIW